MTEQTLTPTPIAEIERIAAGIFARYGIDFAAARRAGGWSNATWMADGLALRLAVRPGNQTIHNDARLAQLLPAAVGYPVTVETGVTDGHAWCLSREVVGSCLGEAWDGLSSAERADALRQLWGKAQIVHRVDPEAAAPLVRRRAWFNSNDAGEADAMLARRVSEGRFNFRQAAVLRGLLACFWQALPAADLRLAHGDLTLDNAIWRDGQVVSLLDFEFALLAPVQLDLNTWLKNAFGPDQDDPALQVVAVAAARPLLQSAADLDLLLGYAVLLELWLLDTWLAHPEGEGPVATWHPYRRLLALAAGQGGYLAPVIAKP